MPVDPTERFSNRVADYAKCRPSYPAELLEFIRDELGLTTAHVIADVGSGTGILSKVFLDHGNVVYGVEPNAGMRGVAEALLAGYRHFHSVPGRAETTLLERDHVDYVVVGQAFHWFDVDGARKEFRRILKPGGWIVLIWNSRRTDSTPFLKAYEAYLEQWGTDYIAVRSRYAVRASLESLFGGAGYGRKSFENTQSLDFDGLRGRILSSSFIPGVEHARYGPMLAALRQLFDEHQKNGRVLLEYDTEVYFGQLT